VWLEEVLTPAERRMASTQTGRDVLQALWGRMLEQVRPRFREVVAEAMGREVNLVGLHLDMATGSILGCFRGPVCANLEPVGPQEGE
jgi:uncharacterized protein YbcI